MSDMWTFSSSSSPPIIHHSSLTQPLPSSSASYHGDHPHDQFTSPQLLPPHHLPSPQVTSPHLVPQPQISNPPFFAPSQHLLSGCNPGFDDVIWNGAELSFLLHGDRFSFQNQNTDLQNQNQFGPAVSHHVEDTHSFVYGHEATPGPVLDPWGTLETQERWSSVSSTEDFSDSMFFPGGYHDNNAPHAFYSPSTPGLSPHYPQTPSAGSTGPQTHPWSDRSVLNSQMFTELNRDQAFSCCGEPRTRTSLLQNQTCLDPEPPAFRGQMVSGAAQDSKIAAGLNQTWTKKKQPENSTKVLDFRLMCTLCQRDFHSLPALNGHMRSHSSFRSAKKAESPPVQPSVSTLKPVSVPVRSRGRRKSRRLSPATGGAALYGSVMLRDERGADVVGVRGHYTPPPMLCPVRDGMGLYCSVTTRRQQRDTHKRLGDRVAMETQTAINQPRINVGRGFQAEIPPPRDHGSAISDPQNALQLWTPWDELETPVNQRRIEALMAMARSSVMPGGGASPEHALQLLSDCRGDFLLTLETLMSTPDSCDTHTGVRWSPAETQLLDKSLRLYHKDFSRVQRAVQTKTVPQCVEYYYLWKKKLSLGS